MSVLFTLEVLPAAEGDCLLLHWGTEADRHLAVIDGGPGRIYEKHLHPRLDEIARRRGAGPLPLDLVMVSHPDNDHLTGIKKLLRALRRGVENREPESQRGIRIERLWLNTFNDILGDPLDGYFRTLTATYQASMGSAPHPGLVDALSAAFRARHGASERSAREAAWDVSQLLAGHKDAREVRDDYRFLFDQGQIRPLNDPVRDPQGQPTLLLAGPAQEPATVEGLGLTLVGPLQAELAALQREFDRYVEKNGHSAEAMLAAYADDSVKNLASIVCIAEYGGKRILLTGDARGDRILAGLEEVGVPSTDGVWHVDVLKVPHHGSDRNVEPAFFRKVVADTYVVSGDGKHGNPDLDTLQWIADARPGLPIRVVLTYGLDLIDANREQDFAKKRQEWVAERDSLQAFFARMAGGAITLQAGAPAEVDLGDERIPR